jgi:hypothetical protein
MKRFAGLLPLVLTIPLFAQNAAPISPDPWHTLLFLQGTWSASTTSVGSSEGKVIGTYTFRPELGNHILARHTTSIEGCKGPATFDCDHGDLLYVYQDAAGQPLKAIYFDNEGHVIHYDVSSPNATTAIFISDASNPGPQFRLIYELKDALMWGRFQMRMPGQKDWKSYLEWIGPKK